MKRWIQGPFKTWCVLGYACGRWRGSAKNPRPAYLAGATIRLHTAHTQSHEKT